MFNFASVKQTTNLLDMENLKYYKRTHKAMINKVIKVAEEIGFSVNVSNQEYNNKKEYIFEFSKYTDYGQDFTCTIIIDSKEVSLYNIWNKVYDYYKDYDPSYEAYLWLDEEGHGKNGAPYEMNDVYEDMKQCKSFVKELADKLYEIC